MDEGLIQFLVIGFFVVISMMEGATRKKRQQGQALQRPPEDELDEGLVPDDIWEEIAELARGGTPQTLDSVFPEPITEEETGQSRVARPIPQVGQRLEEGSPRLPVSVRAGREMAAMTRYELASVVSVASERERAEEKDELDSAAFHRLHSSGLADRKKDEHYAQSGGTPSTMLRFFGERGGRSGELRRAIILSEVLGPPVSLREDRDW